MIFALFLILVQWGSEYMLMMMKKKDKFRKAHQEIPLPRNFTWSNNIHQRTA